MNIYAKTLAVMIVLESVFFFWQVRTAKHIDPDTSFCRPECGVCAMHDDGGCPAGWSQSDEVFLLGGKLSPGCLSAKSRNGSVCMDRLEPGEMIGYDVVINFTESDGKVRRKL